VKLGRHIRKAQPILTKNKAAPWGRTIPEIAHYWNPRSIYVAVPAGDVCVSIERASEMLEHNTPWPFFGAISTDINTRCRVFVDFHAGLTQFVTIFSRIFTRPK
jgi:hypothetical protein